MSSFLSFLCTLGLIAGCVLASRGLIHYFQLESYQFPGYWRTLKRNWRGALAPGLLMTAAWLLTSAAASLINETCMNGEPAPILFIAWGLLLAGAGWAVRSLTMVRNAKKALNFTPRIKRLYTVCFLVFLGVWVLLEALGGITVLRRPSMYLRLLFPMFLPLLTALGGLLAWPVEKLISELYFRDAQRVLDRHPDLIRIGITGSYGKTSVKFILETILQERFRVLVTPASFNTPMGVTKIIRTKLEPGHQVFVAEMGARHVGDIREMCRLVHPKLGVLTSVGPQHLDTFKTIERIRDTKYELMDAVPADGCCFFPDDGSICRELYDRTVGKKKCLAGGRSAQRDLWVEDLRVSASGSSFTLCSREGSVPCTTRLLGSLNIQNILLAATVASYLGMDLNAVANGIRRLQPVEHRLQLMPNRGGLTIIDDAFNSNPRGAEAALEVLKQFPGRRIVITPGMVELGEKEKEYNHALGVKMADCVDEAILVGPRHTQPILEGLREKGFEHVRQVKDLNEATALLARIGRAGDTVLFENDLPDNYSEA